MFTGERKNWILGFLWQKSAGKMAGTKKMKNQQREEVGEKSNYTCKIVALFNLSSLEDIDMKNKNKSA